MIQLQSFATIAQIQNKPVASKSNHVVAEWKNQEAVWTIWPSDTAMQAVITQAIKALSLEVPVHLILSSDSLRDFALLKLKNDSIAYNRIKIVMNTNAKGFIRDHGPWFIFDANDQPARLGFKWANYGVTTSLTRNTTIKDSIMMGKFAGEITGKMKLKTVVSDLVIENGMIEVNNNGVAICFMETILQRNPGYDLPAITVEMKRALGLKKIIWLGSSPSMEKIYPGAKASNIFGFGGNGHIDQYVRFANDTTILIAQIDPMERRFDPVTSGDFFILTENLEYLKKLQMKMINHLPS
ncbi:MAG: agmatine deiminase family protein [Bacteroidetes bacterium]|nr:agmatine deiminase family protein [Bacteroidota bacterium]